MKEHGKKYADKSPLTILANAIAEAGSETGSRQTENIRQGKAYLDKTDSFTMMLPSDEKFQTFNLAKDMREDIRKAEQDKQEDLAKK